MRCGQIWRTVRPQRYGGLGSALRPWKEPRGAFVRWLRPELVRRVPVPASFPAELSAALFPLALRQALAGHVELDAWGFGDADKQRLEAASDAASQASDSGASSGSAKSVQFGQMHVAFFDPRESLQDCVFRSDLDAKVFDGPSGHKASHPQLAEGDEDYCEEVTRLLATPRKQVCWSWAW